MTNRCLFFTLLRSDKLQTDWLPLLISHVWNHEELWHPFKKLKKFAVVRKFKFKWCRYNIDAYVCKVKMERIILFMRNRKSAFVHFSAASSEPSSVRISHGRGNFDFRCWATRIIITSMPMSATYRAMVEHSILFVNIVNRYFDVVGEMVQNSQSLYAFTFNVLIDIHEYIYSHSTTEFTF